MSIVGLSIPPENSENQCFQGVREETSVMKWVNMKKNKTDSETCSQLTAKPLNHITEPLLFWKVFVRIVQGSYDRLEDAFAYCTWWYHSVFHRDFRIFYNFFQHFALFFSDQSYWPIDQKGKKIIIKNKEEIRLLARHFTYLTAQVQWLILKIFLMH